MFTILKKCEVCGCKFKWKQLFNFVITNVLTCNNCSTNYTSTKTTRNIAAFTKPLPILLQGYLIINTSLNTTLLVYIFFITTFLVIEIGTLYIKFVKIK